MIHPDRDITHIMRRNPDGAQENGRRPKVAGRSGRHDGSLSRRLNTPWASTVRLGSSQVVVAFGHAWIGGKRRLVRLHRLRLAIHVIEQHAQVVEQHWVAAAGFHRLAIDLLGLRVAAGFVQKPSQVYIGIEKRRIGGDGLLVRPN
jgi:hypothetical protein